LELDATSDTWKVAQASWDSMWAPLRSEPFSLQELLGAPEKPEEVGTPDMEPVQLLQDLLESHAAKTEPSQKKEERKPARTPLPSAPAKEKTASASSGSGSGQGLRAAKADSKVKTGSKDRPPESKAAPSSAKKVVGPAATPAGQERPGAGYFGGEKKLSELDVVEIVARSVFLSQKDNCAGLRCGCCFKEGRKHKQWTSPFTESDEQALVHDFAGGCK